MKNKSCQSNKSILSFGTLLFLFSLLSIILPSDILAQVPSQVCLGNCPTAAPETTANPVSPVPVTTSVPQAAAPMVPGVNCQPAALHAVNKNDITHARRRRGRGGNNANIDSLIQQLMQLIQQLIQILGGQGANNPAANQAGNNAANQAPTLPPCPTSAPAAVQPTAAAQQVAVQPTTAEPATTQPPAGATPPAGTPAGSPVAINGQLSVCGNRMCNQFGKPIQLRGVSSDENHTNCINAASIASLATDWKADVLRYAILPNNLSSIQSNIDNVVSEAVKNGIYVIFDWHVLGETNSTISQAQEVFTYIAQKYGNIPNVMYETANEPTGCFLGAKSFHEQLIPIIRQYDPDGVIMLGLYGDPGSGCSDQDILSNPISAVSTVNLMYSLHFYAQDQQDHLDVLSRGADEMPTFVTEWGPTAGGEGTVANYVEAQLFIDLMASKQIGWTYYSYGDESAGWNTLISGTCPNGPWTGSSLNEQGIWAIDKLTNPPDNFPTQ